MKNVGMFYGLLEYFTDIWYKWPFVKDEVIRYVFPNLVYCIKKNLATLICNNIPATAFSEGLLDLCTFMT
jgi:hypothetical protein